MRPKLSTFASPAALLLLLAALPLIAAHGDDSASMDMSMGAAGMDMSSGASNTTAEAPAVEVVPIYFRHPSQAGWLYTHAGLMIMSWAFILPPSIMLSVARSRYTLPAQALFHLVNGLGMFTGFVYRHSTPDLYPNNSHVPLGWVSTALTVVWTLTSLVVAYSDYKSKRTPKSIALGGLSARAMAQYENMQPYRDRFSGDSGHGTSLLGGSSRQNSADSIYQSKPEEGGPSSPGDSERGHDDDGDDDGDDDLEPERHGFLGHNRVDRFLSERVSRFASKRLTRIVRFTQIILEKFLLLLGFTALATGIVVWGGLFMKREIFSGLAHWIKGGIFFWYGLLTLGRWMGAFAEFGWAWNLRPAPPAVARWKSRIPSAEFVESFVIWLYGVSNVGLEHLNSWGKGWSAQDLEHVSITLLFFGGGLMGMLVEARWVRDLLDTGVVAQQQLQAEASQAGAEADRQADAEAGGAGSVSPRTVHHHHLLPPVDFTSSESNNDNNSSRWSRHPSASTPLNPLPALTILILGKMMSSHHQTSMTSTMLHASWGTLFMAFALSRCATYFLMFLRPPREHFPSRPPTELVAAFCLIAGGVLFMASARDCVRGFESVGVEAMPVFTVVLGATGVVMAVEVLSFALKGWAVRRERFNG